jgi:threonine aldolase
MFNFKNDYTFIAHENILNALIKYQNEPNVGYGLDKHTLNAKELIKNYISDVDVDIHFLVGGTIANQTVISHILKPYEAVISATTGHINVHETGAIEATGHKVVTIASHDGKVVPSDVVNCVKYHVDEHMVLPKMLYISESTETGTVYSKEELKALYETCQQLGLYLFVDGARLAVAVDKGVISIDDLAHYSDVFYIGGTKNGALLGEAVVIVNDNLKECFRYSIKRNGGMYSKGFVAGICFEELFSNDLFFKLGHNSNLCSKYLADCLSEKGIRLQYECVTNQIFPVVSNELFEKLKTIATFELWEDLGSEKVIRFVCDFKTTKENIDEFIDKLEILMK